MYEGLIDTIKFLVNIPINQIKELVHISKPKKINKGDFFIRSGEIPTYFGFNIKGLFRYYYIDNDGNEFTKGFCAENNFVASYSAMITKKESFFSIEALEDSDILVFNYNNYINLSNKYSSFSILELSLIKAVYIKKEKREKEFLLDDAETRYRSFLVEYSNLESRLKQYHIASYLGITPVALSRIRKKIKK